MCHNQVVVAINMLNILESPKVKNVPQLSLLQSFKFCPRTDCSAPSEPFAQLMLPMCQCCRTVQYTHRCQDLWGDLRTLTPQLFPLTTPRPVTVRIGHIPLQIVCTIMRTNTVFEVELNVTLKQCTIYDCNGSSTLSAMNGQCIVTSIGKIAALVTTQTPHNHNEPILGPKR